MRLHKALIASILGANLFLSSTAGAATITALGLVRGSPTTGGQLALSGDGSTVAATSDQLQAFRWAKSSGAINLGVPVYSGAATNTPVYTSAVSYDGSVIVGSVLYSGFNARGWTWTQGGGYVERTDYTNFGFSSVSADGSRIAGSVRVGTSSVPLYSGPDENITMDNGRFSTAMSADGSVVVGRNSSTNTVMQWTISDSTNSNNQLEHIASSGIELFTGDAAGISADGTTVVGWENGGAGAIRWTQESGAISLSGGEFGAAFDLTADGSVVVGVGGSFGKIAKMWDATGGWRSLSDELTNVYGLDLTDWALTSAIAISDDGNTILGLGSLVGDPVGTGGNSGIYQAWVVDLTASAVPIPPALYLFGTGIIGLIGLAKHKKA